MRLSFSRNLVSRWKEIAAFLQERPQLLNAFVPLIFFLFALLGMPVSSNFSFDTDEGQELMKALLSARGFELYEPIWSDQPPLLTMGLVAWFRVFGSSILSARLLVLCFATLLIWSFFRTLQLDIGSRGAGVGTVFLALSANFLRVSVSVMMGLPCLSLAMLSIYWLWLDARKGRSYFSLLSGAAMAVSLQFKMFSVFLLPLQLLLIWLLKGKRSPLQVGIAALQWLAALSITFGAIGWRFNSLNFNEIFKFHIGENLKSVFINENSFIDLCLMFLQDFDLVLLAGLGSWFLVQKGERPSIFPLLWLATSTLMLLNHKPVWYHHYLLLSIPLAWLASSGAVLIFAERKRWRKRAIALGLLVAIATPIKLGVIQWQNRTFLAESREKAEVVQRILSYQTETNWLFTDNPIYGFYTNLLVPPEIAVLSRKRVASRGVTGDYLSGLLEKYQPEQVILERFPEVYEPLRPDLEARYFKLEESGARRHFVARHLQSHPTASR